MAGGPSQLAAAAWAALASLYWGGMAVVYFLTEFSILALLAGAGVFVLLCWAIRDGAGPRPSGSSYLLAGLSALYTSGACWTFGFAAYIEGHGCALEPETCVGGGLPLIWKVATGAAIVYFGVSWLVNRRRAGGPAGR